MTDVIPTPLSRPSLLRRLAAFARIQGSQPSTWRGIVFILSSAGVYLSPDASNSIIALGLAIAGLIGTLTSDTPAE